MDLQDSISTNCPNLWKLRSRIQHAHKEYEAAWNTISNNEKKVDKLKDKTAHWEEVQHEVRVMSEALQTQLYSRITDMVTHCLSYVFGDEYSCEIQTDQKRGNVEAYIRVLKGDTVMDPVTACGGGVVDIVSMSLRLCAVVGDGRQKNRRILILDEPFKFLSVQYRARAAELLTQLSEQLDFQLIIVSHDPEFIIGEVVEL